MNAVELQNLLTELDACEDARKFCEGKTLAEAWATCKRSDWMLWLVNNAKTTADDRSLRLIAVKCARQVQHLMADERSINALDVAERYANGNATDEELAAASEAAWAASEAAWAAARAAEWAAQSDIIREYLPTIEINNP